MDYVNNFGYNLQSLKVNVVISYKINRNIDTYSFNRVTLSCIKDFNTMLENGDLQSCLLPLF